MTDAEQIDLLRREVADLRERLNCMEAAQFINAPRPVMQPGPGIPGYTPSFPIVTPLYVDPPLNLRPVTICSVKARSGTQLWNDPQ